MQKQYELPNLTVIGEAENVVLGASVGLGDFGMQVVPDFEFEQD